jgi:hypothetical protein
VSPPGQQRGGLTPSPSTVGEGSSHRVPRGRGAPRF